MDSLEKSPQPQFYKISNRFILIIIAMLIFVGVFIALQSQQTVLLIAVLLVGLPFAGLVVSKHTRQTAVVLLLALVPLTGILKALTGSRYAPLTFDLAILLACGLYVLEDLLRQKTRLRFLDFLWLIFLAIAFLQMFNPNVPSMQAGIEGFRKFAFISLTFFVGRHVFGVREMRLFSRLTLIISVFIALYGLKQFISLSALDLRIIDSATASSRTYLMGGWIRPFSTTPGPFHLGLYLVITILLATTFLLNKQTKRSTKIILLAVIMLQGVVLMMTRTKGNWIGLLVGISILAILQSKNPFKAIFRLLALFLVGGLIVSAVGLLTSGKAAVVLQDAIIAVTNPLEAPTFVYRIELWQEIMWPAIQNSPLFGYGTSSAGEGLANLYANTNSQFFASHNLYFKILLELGFIGLFIFILIVFISLRNGWRSIKKLADQQNDTRMMLHWSLAVVSSVLVAGLVIPTLDAYPPNYYFWLTLGILSARKLHTANKRIT